MATIQRINIIGSREGSRNRRRLKANQTGKKFRVGIKSNIEAFYDNPNALRDYFRDIGRMVLAAEGRKANDSHADCYQYFCVPEYGTANGRLHFHAVHFMRTLPTGSVDPNFGRRVRNRRQLNSLQNTWPYGYSMPIAVRYTQDAFSRS